MEEKREQQSGQSEKKASLLDRLIEKFSESRFFTISFVLHVLLILIFGGTVLFEAMQEPPDFEGGEGGFLQAGEEVATPPSAQTQPKETTFTVTTPTVQNTTVAAITTTGQNPLNFQMAAIVTPSTMPKPTTAAPTAAAPTASSAGAAGMTAGDAKQIGDFTKGWGGKGSGSGTGTRAREFAFTAFIAKYNGGNWDSTVDLKDGKIWRGSLPNLLEFMSKASRDKIKTDYKQVEAIPLDSDKIFAVKPPFIFFTGSRDFVLSDKEVENLRKYIRLGGAIWGDSSVPGRGSRFDLAFRREMRKVISDKDKDFEALEENDPMFRRDPYYPEIKKQPEGVNYYQEPVYVMRYFGEIAVIYTPNDYADMWQFGIKQEGSDWRINNDRNEQEVRVALDWPLYMSTGLYIHNANPNTPITALLDTYKFGANMVIHLLTRWENKVRSAPRL